ncbi:signal recognition particle-docking protein FtsY [Roseixanthobacter glucoisosaccharinicivorans]|uniref:signal recognition particle-docking protein FtsY n=1 Tax=Roseixanthobacter glucoisosaccharinicivorans TaxID=3119923 RepID=UPI003729EFC0
MSDSENGPPPAPKKKGLWSRLTGGWGSEPEAPPQADPVADPAPAPLQPEAAEGTEPTSSEAPVGEAEPVPALPTDAPTPSDAPAMGDGPAEEEQVEEGQVEEGQFEEGQFAEASAPEAPAHDPLAAIAPVEEPPVFAEAPFAPEQSAAPSDAPQAGDEPEPAKTSFWRRLTSGLARTASSLTQGITDLVSKRKLDADTLEELEDILIRADLGTATAARIVEAVGRGRHDKMIGADEVKSLIAAEVETILAPVARPLVIDGAQKPFIILMVGVNGSGKTTTIGKLAAQWKGEGRKVMLAAGDTFRAAAIEQLKVWGARTGARVVARAPGADAAGVAHDAITEARAEGADILLIDTAGRLQNRTELMAELEKVVRVVKKLEPGAPHAVLLVLDATVGQNALSQVEVFTKIAGVTGLVMTKLDGTARGGILVAIAAKFGLPVHLIGVGEGAEDLQPFAAADFARAIAGIETDAR